jgi:hypothetical protein
MNRFNRREYSKSERATLDVCYHFITLVERSRNTACVVASELVPVFNNSMHRSLNHMVYNEKFDTFRIVCDQPSSPAKDEISDGDVEPDVSMEIEVYKSNLFAVKNGIKLTLSRSSVIKLLDDDDTEDILSEVWQKALPTFNRDEITKGFRNLMITEAKPYWDRIRNTPDGRNLLISIIDKVVDRLHSNLMIDPDETTISCHELNTGAMPETDIQVRVTTENMQGSRIQLDLSLKPKVD